MKASMTAENVLSEIDKAFPRGKPPTSDQIVTRSPFRDDHERMAIRDFLRGRLWWDITMDVLADYRGDRSAMLSFLTPVAFRYYLPVFLKIAVTDYDRADVSVLTTFLKFSSHADLEVDEYLMDRKLGLTLQQLDAVAHTAAYLENIHGPDDYLSAAIEDVAHVKAAIRARGAG